MAHVQCNPNPNGILVGDCVIRAIAIATEDSWERVYVELAVKGFDMCDMPSSNSVWGSLLRTKGFNRYVIPNTCPDCYTVKDFCNDHPNGTYILGTGTHAVAVWNGDYYDTWDSGNEVPTFYWKKEE